MARAVRSRASPSSKAPMRRSPAKRRMASDPGPHNSSISRRIARSTSAGALASRWATTMNLATSSASGRRSSGSSGISSFISMSRASGRSAAPLGKSRMNGNPVGVEQHQDLELALAGAPPGQCQVEVTLTADHVAVALLKGNHRPPHARQDFPKQDPLRVDRCSGCALIAVVERSAVGDPAGLAVEPCKAPTLAAKPTDVLVRIAPAGEFPIEDRRQRSAIQHIIAGAEIVMAEYRRRWRQHVPLEPAHTPFENRAGRRMTVEIGAKPPYLLCRPDFLIGRQKRETGLRRADRVDEGQLAAEPVGARGESRIERPIAGDPVRCRDPKSAPHDEERLAEDGRVLAGEERFGNRYPRCKDRLLHGEFLATGEARRNARRGGRPQHEPLFAIERATREARVEPPILLKRATSEPCQRRNLHRLSLARRGEKPGQCHTAWFKLQRRRARHRPRSPPL